MTPHIDAKPSPLYPPATGTAMSGERRMMFGFVRKKLGDWSEGQAKKQMEEFLALCKVGSGSEMASVLLATSMCVRKLREADKSGELKWPFPEEYLSGEAAAHSPEALGHLSFYIMQLIKLQKTFTDSPAGQFANSGVVVLQFSVKAVQLPGCFPLGRAIWSELTRGLRWMATEGSDEEEWGQMYRRISKGAEIREFIYVPGILVADWKGIDDWGERNLAVAEREVLGGPPAIPFEEILSVPRVSLSLDLSLYTWATVDAFRVGNNDLVAGYEGQEIEPAAIGGNGLVGFFSRCLGGAFLISVLDGGRTWPNARQKFSSVLFITYQGRGGYECIGRYTQFGKAVEHGIGYLNGLEQTNRRIQEGFGTEEPARESPIVQQQTASKDLSETMHRTLELEGTMMAMETAAKENDLRALHRLSREHDRLLKWIGVEGEWPVDEMFSFIEGREMVRALIDPDAERLLSEKVSEAERVYGPVGA
jgi:hypothetical protein